MVIRAQIRLYILNSLLAVNSLRLHNAGHLDSAVHLADRVFGHGPCHQTILADSGVSVVCSGMSAEHAIRASLRRGFGAIGGAKELTICLSWLDKNK